jgi:hypothetical protein
VVETISMAVERDIATSKKFKLRQTMLNWKYKLELTQSYEEKNTNLILKVLEK